MTETAPSIAIADYFAEHDGPVVGPRLLLGLVVLISAEVFSGASVMVGLWHPWTWIVTFWLYFAHFFLFTTLAIRTGRTSLPSLYLWGVLYGLYEGWITKVIWAGYGADGKFVMGMIGPFGASEISMVFLFHPVMSFILPLAVACVLCPSLRPWFPELAWFTGRTRGARAMRVYIVIAFGVIMAMNGGGFVHLALSLAFILALLVLMIWRNGPKLARAEGARVVAFGRWGVIGLSAYLALLYGGGYFVIRPEALPAWPVQLFTLALYAIPLIGLWRHAPRTPLPPDRITVIPQERRAIVVTLLATCGVALVLSIARPEPVLYLVVVASFVVWTPLGFVLTGLSVWGGRRRRSLADPSPAPVLVGDFR